MLSAPASPRACPTSPPPPSPVPLRKNVVGNAGFAPLAIGFAVFMVRSAAHLCLAWALLCHAVATKGIIDCPMHVACSAMVQGHTVLIPVDGCSINPTRWASGPACCICAWSILTAEKPGPTCAPRVCRSFGPALVSNTWKDFWVFVVGPLIGAVVSVPLWWVTSQPALDAFSIADSDAPAVADVPASQIETPEAKNVDV